MARPAALLALAAAAALAQVPQCPNNVPLCFDKDQNEPVVSCKAQNLTYTFPGCCGDASLKANDGACAEEDPANPTSPTCRYINLEGPILNKADLNKENCCGMGVNFDIISRTTGSCCNACSCFGDPHCISFNNTLSSWILCDGRVKNEDALPGRGNPCPIMQNACRAQRDQVGDRCVWKPQDGTVGESGSPCRSKNKNVMTMYKTKDFDLELTLGERGVIEEIAVTNGKNSTFYLNAIDCMTQEKPFSTKPGEYAPSANPNWLPSQYQKITEAPGSARVLIGGLISGISIQVRCIMHESLSKGSARINVESVNEPDDKRAVSRDSSGVCVKGSIETGLATTGHSKLIDKFCTEFNSNYKAAEALCPKLAENKAVNCIGNYCADTPNPEQCKEDIERFGWEQTWCARNVLATGDASLCNSGDCVKCKFDILDFGWAAAKEAWEGAVDGNGGGGGGIINEECLDFNEMERSLSNPCVGGVSIQYFDTDKNPITLEQFGWTDFVSLYHGQVPCEGALSFSAADAFSIPAVGKLFTSKVRFVQCNAKYACPAAANRCEQEPEVQIKMSTTISELTQKIRFYRQLLREKKVVCKNAPPGDPYFCLGGKVNQDKCLTCKSDVCKA